MTNSLLISSGVIVDIVFFVLLIGGIAVGAQKGLIKCICKLAGTIFSIVFAFLFCIAFANFLESCFGMTTAIAHGLAGSFSGKENYDVALGADVAGAEISAALQEIGIGGFTRWAVGLAYKGVAVIPAGTTTAMMISSVLAKWISIAISFVALIILVKLGAVLIGKLFTALCEKVTLFRILNKTMGGLFGLIEAMIGVFFLLAVCSWIPVESLQNFLSSTTVVGAIYRSEWFANATNYAVSGQWFNEFISNFNIN